jgi:uncharacterized protein
LLSEKLQKASIPAKKIIFELKPSLIHGIGVFATANIPKRILLPLFEDNDHRFIPKDKVKNLGISLKQIRIHSIEYPEGFSAPKNFNRMSVGWYLNHSDTPNAFHDAKYHYYSLRPIKKGEEITIDYNSL